MEQRNARLSVYRKSNVKLGDNESDIGKTRNASQEIRYAPFSF
jgi:hypothetical protein